MDEARIRGLLYLYDVHLLHQEGGVPVAGNTPLQLIIKMQVIAFDDTFKTIVIDHAREFLFQPAQ